MEVTQSLEGGECSHHTSHFTSERGLVSPDSRGAVAAHQLKVWIFAMQTEAGSAMGIFVGPVTDGFACSLLDGLCHMCSIVLEFGFLPEFLGEEVKECCGRRSRGFHVWSSVVGAGAQLHCVQLSIQGFHICRTAGSRQLIKQCVSLQECGVAGGSVWGCIFSPFLSLFVMQCVRQLPVVPGPVHPWLCCPMGEWVSKSSPSAVAVEEGGLQCFFPSVPVSLTQARGLALSDIS